MTFRRPIITGVAAVAVYVVAVVATLGLTGSTHRVRPLFEGFTPPPPYQWVKPPAEFKAGNQKPKGSTTEIAMGADGSLENGVNSQDGQFLINLPANAIPAHGTDTKVVARMTPLDPATLGPVLSGLRPDGNAYRLQLTYQPSGTAAPPLAKPGNVILTTPDPTAILLFSPDGKTWERLQAQPVGAGTVGGQLKEAGYYLGAETGTAAPKSNGSGTGRTLLVAGVTALLAVGLFFGPMIGRRLRRGKSAPPARRATKATKATKARKRPPPRRGR